jgi:hypothetical protein
MTVYNVNIIDLVRELKRIYMSGCEKVNLTIESESTIRINGIIPEEKTQELLPPSKDDILDYL